MDCACPEPAACYIRLEQTTNFNRRKAKCYETNIRTVLESEKAGAGFEPARVRAQDRDAAVELLQHRERRAAAATIRRAGANWQNPQPEKRHAGLHEVRSEEHTSE